uniref:TIL domain containing protein n=1 Tax=Rhipicephalus appendiculatus TaxID=34631 RepID=A0A131YCU7_RHIAP
MQVFIPLLFYCAAFLTNSGLLEARRSGILYYVRGWNGGFPFSDGAGPEGGMWLSPSDTTPWAQGHADDAENLHVSTPSGKQNVGLVTDSGTGRLDDANGPPVGFSSSINKPGRLPRKTFHSGVESKPKEVFSAGTESTLPKTTGGTASSISSIPSFGSIKSSAESPSEAGTRNLVHKKLSGTSLGAHLLKGPTTNAGSDKASVSSSIPTLISGTTPSGGERIFNKVTVKLQDVATVNGDLAAPQVGPTSIGVPGHLGASDSTGLVGTVVTPSGHNGFNPKPTLEGAITPNSISRPPVLPLGHGTPIHENKSSGSVVGITVSASAERPGIPSLAPGHTTTTLPLGGGALSFSKGEPAGNVLLDKMETLPHKKNPNDLVINRNNKSGLSLGTSESAAGVRPSLSFASGHFPTTVNASVVVGGAVSGHFSSKSASESPEKGHVGDSGTNFEKDSSHALNVHAKALNNITAGMTGSAFRAVGTTSSVASVKNEQGRHVILETALQKTSAISRGRASGGPHGPSGSISIHESNPSDILVNPAMSPSTGSKVKYPSPSLGDKVTPATKNAGGATPENPSLAGKPVSGSVLNEIVGKEPENDKEHGSFRHNNLSSDLNNHLALLSLASGGPEKPHLGSPGTFRSTQSGNGLGQLPSPHAAVKVTDGVPNATVKQNIGNNRAYGLFMDTSLPSGFSISSTGVPTGSGSNMFNSFKNFGHNTFETSRVASTNVEHSRSSEFREHAGRFQDSSSRPPVQNIRGYGPQAIGIQLPGIASGVSQLSTTMKAAHHFAHVQPSPSIINAGTAGVLTNGLSNPSRPSQHRGTYGSFVHTSLPSGFSISRTGIPTGPGSHMYRASTHIEPSPTYGITGAAATLGKFTRPSEVNEDGGFPASSPRATVQNGHQYAPHAHKIEPPGLDSGTSESSATLKTSHPLVHTEASPGSGHARAVGMLKQVPGLRSPSLPQQGTRAYGFFTHTSLPSGFSISSVGTPIGAGSRIFRSSQYFRGPSTSRIVRAAGTHDRPSHTAEMHHNAGGPPVNMVRTKLQHSGHSALHVPRMKPFGFTDGISKSHAPIKNSHVAINDQASPITGKVGAEHTLMMVPGVINPTQYPKRKEAYASFDHTNRPHGSSVSTGAPIGAGANILRSAKLLGGSAKSGIMGATGIPGQPSFSEEAGVHTRGFPAIHPSAQFQNSGQYSAQFLGRHIAGYGSGILESSAPATVSQPSVHVQASASGNAGALSSLMNVPVFINPPRSQRIIGADGSFMRATPPPGFEISSQGAPIRAVSNIYRPSEHLGGASGSGITTATVSPGIPSRYSGARDPKALPASSGRANFGIRGQYLPPTLEQQMPGFADGISRLSPPLNMPNHFGRMQPSLSTETAGSERLLQNVPGLSNQPQSSQSNGAYGSLSYHTPLSGFSISNSRTPLGVRSPIFRSTERLQGSRTRGIIKARGTVRWPLHRSEVHQDLGAILTSNTRQPENIHQFPSQGLEKQTYGFTAGISDSSANLNGNPNTGNAGVVGPFTEVNGANKASQHTESSVGGQPSSSTGGYNILPGRAGPTNFGSIRLANDVGHRGFRTPGDIRRFVNTEIPQSTQILPPPPTLAGTRNPGGHFRTSSDRRQPQRAQFGSLATYGSDYPGVFDSRFTNGIPNLPTVAVPKIIYTSKPVGSLTGSPFTITRVVNERPTHPNYVSAFNGGFNAERRKLEPEVTSPYKYLRRTITSSSKTRRADSYEPGRPLDLRHFEIGSHHLKWLRNQRGVPVREGFTADGWKTSSGESSGGQASTTRSPPANGVANVGSIIGQGDTIYKPVYSSKPDYSSPSEVVGARRRFLDVPRFEQATKPTGRFFPAGGVAYPGTSSGNSLLVPETLPSSFNTGSTTPAHEAGFRNYNPKRNFRDIAGYESNRAMNDLRRLSASATAPEYDTRYLTVSRRQPTLTNEYRVIPYSRHSRNSIPYTSSPSDKPARLSDASNGLNDNTGFRSTEAGGGWKASLSGAPRSSIGFALGSTRHILPGTGAYSSGTVGRGRSVFIGGREGSPNTDTAMSSILDARLRRSMSIYPSKHRSSGGPYPYFPQQNSANSFSNIGGFVVGHDGGRGNTDNARFPVSTGYRDIAASPGPNTGYTTNNPLYPSDGSHGYLSRSTSPRHFSDYSGIRARSGHKRYQPFFRTHSASDSSVSSQYNIAGDPRGAWQGIGTYPVSASN